MFRHNIKFFILSHFILLYYRSLKYLYTLAENVVITLTIFMLDFQKYYCGKSFPLIISEHLIINVLNFELNIKFLSRLI